MYPIIRRRTRPARRVLRVCVVAVLVPLGMVALTTSGGVAQAAPPPGLSPVLQRSADNVTADALPTVQIDGVVWTERVVGNQVFAGGSFANARPAGAAPGTQLVPRKNLLSFDITTGVLNTSFAPSLNGEVKALAVSMNGKRLFVGGSFTVADGAKRGHIAAYSIATGRLIQSWAPSLNAEVNSITVTHGAVYVGGNFSMADNRARGHLAAFDPATGALRRWAPTANGLVQAVQVTPDHTRVIAGGSFTKINHSPAYGLGAVDATNGALYPWAANKVVRDAGRASSILSLTTDGAAIYSTAYVYGKTGNFEGVLSADPDSGKINWLADCHGDTYGTFPANGIVYVVSHMHYCANIGGFPDTDPRTIWHRATAFTTQATGTVATNGEPGGAHGNFAGEPSPSLIDWFPELTIGTFTGQSQAAWSITGNSQYVVLGGEFPRVNGVAQQGLVRFAVPALAPNAQGPRVSAGDFTRQIMPLSPTSARLSWQTNWDRDDRDLTYKIERNGTLVHTVMYPSESWNRPTIGWIDTGLSPGTSYTYRIVAADQDGNSALANTVTIMTPTSGTGPVGGAYPQDVINAGARHYWRLDRLTGTGADADLVGFDDLTVLGGMSTRAGAIDGDSDTGLAFNGSAGDGYAYSANAARHPNTFSIGAWFKAGSRSDGGKIVGFGSSQTGASQTYDRQIYMDPSGHVRFGVFHSRAYTIRTPHAYRDASWHQVVATLSSKGMALYVDGALVGKNSGTTVGQPYRGYWRVGGDRLAGWPGAPSSSHQYFLGSIDEVAIYPSALTLTQVRAQYLDSGRTKPGFRLPTAAFSESSTYLRVDFDGSGSVDPDGTIKSYRWAFGDGTTGTGGGPSHTYKTSGTYTVGLTVTDNSGGTGSVSQQVTV